MGADITTELNRGLPLDGPRLEYTRKALHTLPELHDPLILDVGCGKGSVTLELARLSNGRVVGLDPDKDRLTRLSEKANGEGLGERIETVAGSMFDMRFPEESFDLIWTEGAIWIIGFEKGLREWRPLIRPGGFLVVHEMAWLKSDPPPEIRDYWMKRNPGIETVEGYLRIIAGQDYRLLCHFALPPDLWWEEYYGPLQMRVQDFGEKFGNDSTVLKTLDSTRHEIDLYKRHMEYYGSAFFVLEKPGPTTA